jgi:hypothetical protein
MIAVQLLGTLCHQPRGPVQRRPRDEKRDGVQQAAISFGVIEGTLFRLDVIEVRQPLQIVTQVARRERSLEAGPAGNLCRIATPQGIQRFDARILPLKVGPASPELGCLDGPPRLLGPACREQPLGDLGGNLRDLPNAFLVCAT